MSPEEKAKADEIYKAIIGKERNTLVKRYGKDAEKVAKGRAIKQAQKLAEKKMEPSKNRLKEMVKAALMQEKAGFTNQFDNDPALKGGQKKLPDGLQKAIISKAKGKMEEGPEDKFWATYVKSLVNDIRLNGVDSYTDYSEDDFIADYEEYIGGKMMGEDYDPDQAQLDDEDEIFMSYDDEGKPLGLGEDLDLGHTDNEPHMLKKDLYHIGKYAMDLYQMVDQFEGIGEVDFPHWWQSKIIKAKEMMSSAKHYLDFETREPEIDAMVGAIDMSGALDNVGVDENQVDMFATKASRTDNAKETYFKFLKDFAKSAGVSGEELGKMSYNDLENKFGEKLTRKYGLKKSNVADRARELVSKGVIQVDEKKLTNIAERIAKRVKEDVVKGSNIRKDSKGKWRVLSGKTGKMWPQTYDSKKDAEDALQAYHANK
jgi:hypothetical protein